MKGFVKTDTTLFISRKLFQESHLILKLKGKLFKMFIANYHDLKYDGLRKTPLSQVFIYMCIYLKRGHKERQPSFLPIVL